MMLDNEFERLQACRLARKILSISSALFPACICRSLVAIARDGGHGRDKDKLVSVSIAILCELGEFVILVFFINAPYLAYFSDT